MDDLLRESFGGDLVPTCQYGAELKYINHSWVIIKHLATKSGVMERLDGNIICLDGHNSRTGIFRDPIKERTCDRNQALTFKTAIQAS